MVEDYTAEIVFGFHPETALFPFGCVTLHNYSSTYWYTPPHSCLSSLPKEKIARFRIENCQFQHPETKEFPDGNCLVKIKSDYCSITLGKKNTLQNQEKLPGVIEKLPSQDVGGRQPASNDSMAGSGRLADYVRGFVLEKYRMPKTH